MPCEDNVSPFLYVVCLSLTTKVVVVALVADEDDEFDGFGSLYIYGVDEMLLHLLFI